MFSAGARCRAALSRSTLLLCELTNRDLSGSCSLSGGAISTTCPAGRLRALWRSFSRSSRRRCSRSRLNCSKRVGVRTVMFCFHWVGERGRIATFTGWCSPCSISEGIRRLMIGMKSRCRENESRTNLSNLLQSLPSRFFGFQPLIAFLAALFCFFYGRDTRFLIRCFRLATRSFVLTKMISVCSPRIKMVVTFH